MVEFHVGEDEASGSAIVAGPAHELADQSHSALFEELAVDRLIEVPEQVDAPPAQPDPQRVPSSDATGRQRTRGTASEPVPAGTMPGCRGEIRAMGSNPSREQLAYYRAGAPEYGETGIPRSGS